jgi:hypothetical protein
MSFWCFPAAVHYCSLRRKGRSGGGEVCQRNHILKEREGEAANRSRGGHFADVEGAFKARSPSQKGKPERACIPRHHQALRSLGTGARDSPAKVRVGATDAQHPPRLPAHPQMDDRGHSKTPSCWRYIGPNICRYCHLLGPGSTISGSGLTVQLIPVPPLLQSHLSVMANEILALVPLLTSCCSVRISKTERRCIVCNTCIVGHGFDVHKYSSTGIISISLETLTVFGFGLDFLGCSSPDAPRMLNP